MVLEDEAGSDSIEDLHSNGSLRDFRRTGVVSPGRMRAIDKNAMALGVSGSQLMESAGKSLAGVVMEYAPEKVLILCGSGNNGGDGFVAARYLQNVCDVDLLYYSFGDMTPDAEANLRTLLYCDVSVHRIRCPGDLIAAESLFSKADVIVDAMLGTGARKGLVEPYLSMVRLADSVGAVKISADIPTEGFNADRTIGFHLPKSPESEFVDIGIPLDAEIYTGPGDLTMVPAKKSGSHKGAGGKVLIIGGGPYQGAPYLAALSALRGGADIVRVATPCMMHYPDLIVSPLSGGIISGEHTEELISLGESSDCVVCGCGLGNESHDVIREIAPYFRKVVFDADALNYPLPFGNETIITPHSGEFKRISGSLPPKDLYARGMSVRNFAGSADGRLTVLLKGATDVISDGGSVRFNRTGSPAMTKGGTGDVLAGLTGALFSRMSAFDAACISAWINGAAGEKAAGLYQNGLLASDIIDKIPEIMNMEI
ncbi:bifunctional ADP-dependent NAD(P)H-hydrate dehydratase/NAD(P)H-hydrate epimerase [Methanoplanus limicola]|uniref:ADP-dependent (S)-NAD(P)H-hydrate dehydratase n=1 Tax=Methanoplanus limicola DSM 2279 TaxID=937775 RepID=H1Z2B9_9EURY|nr:bifunctional ADP-dependent NAD(P)H-hydrate dehydratase/NAD(P)H-hydrate epimerase [Methanoplanus limicola]EHQ34648.1 YjeF-related protein [Methanoplanus limicola DSM 2279]